jgi:rfaE bifunctional protein nucleotidyltransferase chain/domain
VPGVRLVTPNRNEAKAHGLPVTSTADAARAALILAGRWRAHGVAVTLGADGAVLGIRGRLPLVVPVPSIARQDPCGAGDCFAVAAARTLGRGCVLPEAVTEGVRAASSFVAGGGVASLQARDGDDTTGPQLVEDVRRRGGTVVATSGCFDLLHAGHVAMLQAARSLGDVLVVLLNSDRSVQDLKGADRPIVGQDDRAAVLRGLGCVDVVEVFDETTPTRALEQLQPDLFVKGDDYGSGVIPESAVVGRWGGEVVVVPYLEGRSTSRLIEEVHG